MSPEDIFGKPWTPESDLENDDGMLDESEEFLELPENQEGILLLPREFEEAYMGIEVLVDHNRAVYDADLCVSIIQNIFNCSSYEARMNFQAGLGSMEERGVAGPVFVHRMRADWDAIERDAKS